MLYAPFYRGASGRETAILNLRLVAFLYSLFDTARSVNWGDGLDANWNGGLGANWSSGLDANWNSGLG